MKIVEEDTIDLLELARALWKNILAIALAAVLAGSAAFAYTAFMIVPQYTATTSLYVNSSSFRLGATSYSISASEMTASNSLVSVYLYILESRTTLEEVIQTAGLSYAPEELSEMISAKGVSGTAAVEVAVTSPSPAEAELIANTIAKILPDRISDIVDGSSVKIVDYAIIPSRRSGPNIVKNTAMGILAGTVLTILTGAVLLIGIRRIVHQGFTSLVVLLWENFRPIMRPKRRFFAHRFFCFEKRRKGNVSRKIFAADERDAGPRI